jgi:hypothetical protein
LATHSPKRTILGSEILAYSRVRVPLGPLEFRVYNSGIGVKGLGFRIDGLEFKVQDLGLRV